MATGMLANAWLSVEIMYELSSRVFCYFAFISIQNLMEAIISDIRSGDWNQQCV